MWKSRVSSTPPRPKAGSSKHIQVQIPSQQKIENGNTSSARSRASSAGSSQARSTSASPPNHHRNKNSQQYSPSVVNRRAVGNRSPSPQRGGSQEQQSPTTRTATTDEKYWTNLSRPRSAHLQLRGEISSLRTRIQRQEIEENHRRAQQEKYKKVEKLFEDAKKMRQQHQQIRDMRQRAASQHKHGMWQQAQEQHMTTKLRMQKLFQEKHDEVQENKNKMNRLREETNYWKNSNFSSQQKTVEELRTNRQISKLQAAANHARYVQQCRDEFDRDVGSVTKQRQQEHAYLVENRRDMFNDERAASQERRMKAKEGWIRSNVSSREEMNQALNKAKQTEAKMLLEERRRLLAFERRLNASKDNKY